MTLKYKVLSLAGAVGIGFATGHFLLPAKVVETKIVYVEKEKRDNSVTHTTTTKKPDGSVITVTEVDKHVTTDTQSTSTQSKVTTYDTSKLRVSVIAATSLSNPAPVYGAHVSYQVLGPIEVGVLGLTNGTFGASIGIRF